jgi:CDP-diacylglycerol---glycerol-3-phosphate 3-phosphatidyltransferase
VNLPNTLSISRIPMVFLIVYLMEKGLSQWTLGLFVLSALTDWLDGYLARKWCQITDFGKFMDALADKVLTVGLFVALLALGKLPDWALFLVLLIVTREFLVTGLRLVAAGKGRVLSAEKLGKWKTALQMVTIGFFLMVDLDMSLDFTFQCYKCGEVILLVATVLTVISGASYMFQNRDLFRNEVETSQHK